MYWIENALYALRFFLVMMWCEFRIHYTLFRLETTWLNQTSPRNVSNDILRSGTQFKYTIFHYRVACDMISSNRLFKVIELLVDRLLWLVECRYSVRHRKTSVLTWKLCLLSIGTVSTMAWGEFIFPMKSCGCSTIVWFHDSFKAN